MTRFVYHFFEDNPKISLWENQRRPILLSILSLRKVSPSAQITVIDSGVVPQQWEPYRAELDFEVIRDRSCQFNLGNPLCNSRSFEKLWHISENPAFDGDVVHSVAPTVLFQKNPDVMPYLDSVCGGDREGIFCIDRNSPRSMDVIADWKAHCLLFMKSGSFQQQVYNFNRHRPVDLHVILQYLLSRYVPLGWISQSPLASYQIFLLTKENMQVGALESLNFNDAFVGFDVRRAMLAFVESAAWVSMPFLKFATPKFSLRDLRNPDKLSDIKKHLNITSDLFFRIHDESPLWEPPIQSENLLSKRTGKNPANYIVTNSNPT